MGAIGDVSHIFSAAYRPTLAGLIGPAWAGGTLLVDRMAAVGGPGCPAYGAFGCRICLQSLAKDPVDVDSNGLSTGVRPTRSNVQFKVVDRLGKRHTSWLLVQ